MNPALTAFERRLDEIAFALADLESLQRPGNCPLAMTTTTSRHWRRLVYSATIMNLYGTLEQFMIDLSSVIVRTLPRLYARYSELPKALQDAHLTQTIKVLRDREMRRWSEKIDVANMVSELGKCLEDDAAYGLNEHAFAEHSSNFRADTIKSFLARLEIPYSGHAQDSEIAAALTGVLQGMHHDAESVINNLAERRNEISHGDYTDLLSSEILLGYLMVLRGVGRSIDRIAQNHILGLVGTRHGHLIGSVKHFYSKVGIASIELTAGDLSLGDRILSHSPSKATWLTLRVSSIEIHRIPCSTVRAIDHKGQPIGVDFGEKLKAGTVLYKFPDEVRDLV
jgi:hypothetical protein